MEPIHVEFLNILACGLKGISAESNREISESEADALLQLAREHKVLPLFYEAAHSLPAFADRPQLRRQVRGQVMSQAIKTDAFVRLYSHLRENGCTALVVKGVVCRSLYPKPDLRPSADEDLLIPPGSYRRCHEILLSFGLNTDAALEEADTAYEVPYRAADNPLYIEVHKSLFPPESEAYGDWNRFFDGVFSRAVPITVQGTQVLTLSHTDHLLYLFLHAFKHFLHSGFGIRQVCDIVLYAQRHGAQADWTAIRKILASVHAEVFAAVILRIGEKYLGFDADTAQVPMDWCQNTPDEGALLDDLLSGGIYGGVTLSRRHSSSITLDAVAAQKQGKTPAGVLTTLFPPVNKLESRYPYLKKHPAMLPVAWCQRFFTYGSETRRESDSSAAEALKIGIERLALLKKYNIVE